MYKQKKEELTEKFNELEKKKVIFIQSLKEVEAEQLRLQGAFKLLEELEKSEVEKEAK
jgi:predicted nuclease with TOPRIM domain